MGVNIGDRHKVHMDGDYEIGREVLNVSGWFRVVAVEPGTFMECKLYTLEKVCEAEESDYASLECNDHCSKCGSNSLRYGLDMVVTCNKCGHWC